MDFQTADLDRMFTQTRDELESMRAPQPRPGPTRERDGEFGSGLDGGLGNGLDGGLDGDGHGEAGGAGDVPGAVTGEACNGQVRAVMVEGRLTSIWVDPELKNIPLRLREHLVAAVNAALEAQLAGAGGAAGTTVDHTLLAEQLRQTQDESLRQMSMFEQAIAEAVARLDRTSRG